MLYNIFEYAENSKFFNVLNFRALFKIENLFLTRYIVYIFSKLII